MVTYNIRIPSSLGVMNPAELERVVLTSIKKQVSKRDLLEMLASRYKTRRGAINIANQILPTDLGLLHECLSGTGCGINYDEVYFITADAHRGQVTLRQ